MDSRDTIEPFTAYLSTNCQVCLYLIDYVVEHAQKHTQKPIEQQIWFNSMIRCRFCPNKMPFDRIPAHIERKHSGSESNTKYRKVNQPKHDCDLLRNSLALTSSPQTLHTANQSEPIACHISSRMSFRLFQNFINVKSKQHSQVFCSCLDSQVRFNR